MPWFRVDDGFWSHPKTLQLSDGAVALWLRAGSWSMHHLTDGLIPDHALRILAARPRNVGELQTVSLWLRAKDGYQFHDWEKYQPTRLQVEADRQAAADRKRKSREKSRRDSPVTDAGVTEGVTPTPSHPIPSTTSNEVVEVPRKRGSRIPEPFIVTRDMRSWAAERTPGVDVNSSTEKFANYWRAKAGRDATKRDWEATWHNWLINEFERTTTATRKPKAEQITDVLEQGRQLQQQEDMRAIG